MGERGKRQISVRCRKEDCNVAEEITRGGCEEATEDRGKINI